MLVKISATTKKTRPLKDSQDRNTQYTGLLINDRWYNIQGDHRNLYNKTVEMEFNGDLCRLLGAAPAASSNGTGKSAPTPATRIPLSQILEAARRIYRALPEEWAQDPGGCSRAYASVIQTVIKGIIEGAVEIDADRMIEPPPSDPEDQGWAKE